MLGKSYKCRSKIPKKWHFLGAQKLKKFIRLKTFPEMREYASFIEIKYTGARGTATNRGGQKGSVAQNVTSLQI